jgi:hypothetical protein
MPIFVALGLFLIALTDSFATGLILVTCLAFVYHYRRATRSRTPGRR